MPCKKQSLNFIRQHNIIIYLKVNFKIEHGYKVLLLQPIQQSIKPHEHEHAKTRGERERRWGNSQLLDETQSDEIVKTNEEIDEDNSSIRHKVLTMTNYTSAIKTIFTQKKLMYVAL